jgi:hypothetical protein
MERTEIRKEFKKFARKPMPTYMQMYDDNHDHLIAEVFMIVKAPTGIIGTDTTQVHTEYVFPIAKVMQVGTQWKGIACKAGDFVRLKDWDGATLKNPRYEAWRKNDYSKNPDDLKPVGQAPPPVINRIWDAFSERLFSPDPFEMDATKHLPIFFFATPHILMKIKDANKYIADGVLAANTEYDQALEDLEKTQGEEEGEA